MYTISMSLQTTVQTLPVRIMVCVTMGFMGTPATVSLPILDITVNKVCLYVTTYLLSFISLTMAFPLRSCVIQYYLSDLYFKIL